MKIMSVDTVDASQSSVELNDTDIPGHLDEPFEALSQDLAEDHVTCHRLLGNVCCILDGSLVPRPFTII